MNIHDVNSKATMDSFDDIEVEVKYDVFGDYEAPNFSHYHSSYEITFVINSDNLLFSNDVCYRLLSSQLVLIAPYTTHAHIYKTNVEYHRIGIHFEAECIEELLKLCDNFELDRIFGSKGDNPGIRVIDLDNNGFTNIDNLFLTLIGKYETYNERRDHYSFIQLKLSLASFLLDLYQLLQPRVDKAVNIFHTDIIKDIMRFIDRNYMNDISLSMIEDSIHISKFHVSRLFKKVSGVTIIQYLQYRRITEAKRRLCYTDASILSIGYDCGFNSIQHFNRVFKQITKITPKVWRNRYSRTTNLPGHTQNTERTKLDGG